MNAEKINAKRLWVVKPSIVVSDSVDFVNDKMVHTVGFIHSPKNISIAINFMSFTSYDVFDGDEYSLGVGSFCRENDLYLDVFPGDRIALIKYLWKKEMSRGKSNISYDKQLREYLYSLKPTYTISELKEILFDLKGDVEKQINAGLDVEDRAFVYKCGSRGNRNVERYFY